MGRGDGSESSLLSSPGAQQIARLTAAASVLGDASEWRDRSGQAHQISEMSESHLQNTLSMLLRRAQVLKAGADAAAAPMPSALGELSDASEMIAEREFLTQVETPAREWIESTPLVRAIRAELKERARAEDLSPSEIADARQLAESAVSLKEHNAADEIVTILVDQGFTPQVAWAVVDELESEGALAKAL